MSRVGKLEFSIKGLAEELRRRRDSERGPAVLAVLLIASLLVLTNSKPTGAPPPPPVPKAHVSPTEQDFGPQRVGTRAGYQEFSLINDGPVRITPKVMLRLTHANAFILERQCSALEPGQQCTIGVRFVPQDVGEESGQLVVDDESGVNLATVDLSGTGELKPTQSDPKRDAGGRKPPTGGDDSAADDPGSVKIIAEPSVLDFGEKQIGSGRSTQSLTLQNSSARQFSAGYPTLSESQSANFRVLNCQFIRYEPKGKAPDSCKMDVSFDPVTSGEHEEIVEIREYLAPGVPKNNAVLAKITLKGSGISAAVNVNPRTLDFSEPNPRQQDVSIENVGEVDVRINAAVIMGGDSNRFTLNANACRSPLIAHSKCVIKVTHRISQQQRSEEADLEISHTAANTPDKVKLFWKPTPLPEFSISPESLDLVMEESGLLRPLQVTVTNVGVGPANSVFIGFVSRNASSFRLANDSCSGKPLAAQGGQCTVTLEFAPSNRGAAQTNLVVSDGGLKALRLFPVTGRFN